MWNRGMQMKIFILIFSLLIISLIPNISATEDLGVYSTTGGSYEIELIQWSAIKQNQDFYMWFRVNDDKGKVIPTGGTVNCSAYMWKPDTLSQFALVGNARMDVVSPTALRAKINASFMNEIGEYTFSVNCEDATFGGWIKGKILVTPSGNGANSSTIAFFILVIILIYGITLVGYLKQDYYITILGSMAMIFLGIYLFNNGIIIFRDDLTKYISYLTIGLGAIISVVMSIFIIQDNM